MAGNKSLVAVVIPVYQADLTDAERASLRQCMHVLGNYPVIVVKPESLDLSAFQKEYPSLTFQSFDNSFFKGVDAYNRLMVSIDFYKTFTAYEYMLIYQLDAFVFRDELKEWCAKGYDYIGAPSLHQPEFDSLPAASAQEFANALSTRRVVLNGGLSLRRIPSILRYLKIYNTFYPAWKGNEDMLFCQEATRLKPMKLFMKLPDWQEALRFAFEKSPAATYELTNHQLPFACHAWERYDPAFWAPFMAVNQ
ncbi:hypothetical protein SAMN04487996_114165 [Dyadobacter soli]|uniref:DUF5672 domain-containing protein n=1 Tax=Dyadobacter soli TaxID=659014 RepID=A0A1G7QVH2_9BACT|nr:DUF5672 family protein [Dyadobacter soli]SDG02505.1 hypothetical protein SAMN04487996_114165 [Dyadobacter soli]